MIASIGRILQMLAAAALVAACEEPASEEAEAETSLTGADLSDVVIETVPVADGLYMLLGSGGNIGVSAGEDGIYLIDDQYAPLTGRILDAVAEIQEGPIRFVVNTHWHGDHTGGNENLGETGTVIIAHDNVYARMSTDNFMPAFDREIPAAPAAALPVITFNDRSTLHLNGEDVSVIHVAAAHTDGDSILVFPGANVIYSGDIYFNKRFPFIDIFSGGSVDGNILAVESVLAIADENTVIIPGHGPLSNRAELEFFSDMLVTMRARTLEAIAAGMTMEDYVASEPTADLGIEGDPRSFVSILFMDLTAAADEDGGDE